jgi:hypothetical protein
MSTSSRKRWAGLIDRLRAGLRRPETERTAIPSGLVLRWLPGNRVTRVLASPLVRDSPLRPAGLVFPVLAGLSLSVLGRTRAGLLAAVLLSGILVFDARGLARYLREGRSDWRPLARFLASRPASEQIFTENQYAQLCMAYYLCGPDWLFREARGYRPVSNLECEPVRLTWSWPSGTTAWLVQAGDPRCLALREWAGSFPATPFPTAEGPCSSVSIPRCVTPRRGSNAKMVPWTRSWLSPSTT